MEKVKTLVEEVKSPNQELESYKSINPYFLSLMVNTWKLRQKQDLFCMMTHKSLRS